MQKFDMKKFLYILVCLIICFSCINQKEQITYNYVKTEVIDKTQKIVVFANTSRKSYSSTINIFLFFILR